MTAVIALSLLLKLSLPSTSMVFASPEWVAAVSLTASATAVMLMLMLCAVLQWLVWPLLKPLCRSCVLPAALTPVSAELVLSETRTVRPPGTAPL